MYRDKKSGLWVAVLDAGTTAAGQRRRVYRRAKTKAEAISKLDRVRSDLAVGRPVVDQRTTVGDYLERWLDDHLPGQVKESTARGYRWMLGKHVIPRIGSVSLATLSPEHVEQMLGEMEELGLSPATRRQARVILGRALATAEKRGHIVRNAAKLADAPRSDRVRIDDSLSIQEAQAVLAVVARDPLRPIAELVLRLGLRQGEVLALRWSDIDGLDPCTDEREAQLVVRHTLKRRPRSAGGGWYLDTPKTARSHRTLPLPQSLVKCLRSHRSAQAAIRLRAGSAWHSDDFVFATAIGTPLDARNVLRWWHSATEAAGIGRRRFHATRHTAATLLLDAGEPLERVSALLGHSSYAVTADVYASVTNRATREAVEVLDGVLGVVSSE